MSEARMRMVRPGRWTGTARDTLSQSDVAPSNRMRIWDIIVRLKHLGNGSRPARQGEYHHSGRK